MSITFSEYIANLSLKLESIYAPREANSIATLYLEEALALNRNQVLMKIREALSDQEYQKLLQNESRLLQAEPVQYVTGTAWFYGLNFFVDSNVLIPRQETEILVDFIIKKYKNQSNLNILDIGTGSGCIAISLKKNLPNTNVFAIDISAKVIEICKSNAKNNSVVVQIAQFDILSENIFPFDVKFDIMVSNPPYVTNSEKKLMHQNVVNFEPELALYVEDINPLIFYKKISKFAGKNGASDCELYFEINEKFSDEVVQINNENGFITNEVIIDFNAKPRFVRAQQLFSS
jgi:release factor glutamine methyltransferase